MRLRDFIENIFLPYLDIFTTFNLIVLTFLFFLSWHFLSLPFLSWHFTIFTLIILTFYHFHPYYLDISTTFTLPILTFLPSSSWYFYTYSDNFTFFLRHISSFRINCTHLILTRNHLKNVNVSIIRRSIWRSIYACFAEVLLIRPPIWWTLLGCPPQIKIVQVLQRRPRRLPKQYVSAASPWTPWWQVVIV